MVTGVVTAGPGVRNPTGSWDVGLWAAWPSPLLCAIVSDASVSGPLGAFWFEPILPRVETVDVSTSGLTRCPGDLGAS